MGPAQRNALAEDQKLTDAPAAAADSGRVDDGNGDKAAEAGPQEAGALLKQIVIIGPDGKAKVVAIEQLPGQPANGGEAEPLLQFLGQPVAEPFTPVSPPKYVIGVGVSETPSVVWSQLKRDAQPGVVVAKVMEETPASQAGIQENDIILKAGDKAIGDQQALVAAIEEAAESPMTLTILRGGEELTMEVTPRANEAAKVTAQKILGTKWTGQGGVHAFGPGVLLQEGQGPQADMKQELDQLRSQLEQLQKSVDELKTK